MAIKMLREPSTAPNINNIDDIIGLRYAYGNKNGAVLNKGNQCKYSIIGSTFKIESGRLVLQGVECDIDANGVSIVVDNLSQVKYYSVYLEVNLATNTASIKSTYDDLYPRITPGDDLTANSTGTAFLLLYQFSAKNGSITINPNIELPVINYAFDNKVDYANTSYNYVDANGALHNTNSSFIRDTNRLDAIETRLNELGFKQGSISGVNASITKQAKYAILNLFDQQLSGFDNQNEKLLSMNFVSDETFDQRLSWSLDGQGIILQIYFIKGSSTIVLKASYGSVGNLFDCRIGFKIQ